MLTFHQTMDPHSLDVRREVGAEGLIIHREDKYLGQIQWHKGDSPPRFIPVQGSYLTLDELKEVWLSLREAIGQSRIQG